MKIRWECRDDIASSPESTYRLRKVITASLTAPDNEIYCTQMFVDVVGFTMVSPDIRKVKFNGWVAEMQYLLDYMTKGDYD